MAKKPAPDIFPTPEEELERQIDELLLATRAARLAAAQAYEFSGGNAYAYAAVQACTKASSLATRILGHGQQN